MKLHMLDMGSKIYGDCIVAVEGDKTILVDGAHPGDWQRTSATPSIPEQLVGILGAPPHNIDLLVVTHCHSDHIGCLPKLVADGTVAFGTALVADEALGFPSGDGGGSGDALDDTSAKVVAAMREEPQPYLKGAALDQFLSDAVKLKDSYGGMLRTLEQSGTKIVRYTGADATVREVEKDFAAFHLQVLGPTKAHLKTCSQALVSFSKNVRDAVDSMRRADATITPAQLYRSLIGQKLRADARIPDDIREFLDRAGPGAALNDQSIVLKLGTGAQTVLLTGDMQLAKPEIAGLDEAMAKLLQKVETAGPYAFIKLPHHASYNGLDKRVLQAFGSTPAFGISTGRGDLHHPDRGVLDLLESVVRDHDWARTDKNGLVEVSFANDKVKMTPSRGALNDTSDNTADDSATASEELPVEPLPESLQGPSEAREVREEGGVTLVRTAATEQVEITARIPHLATRITITVEVAPHADDLVPKPIKGDRKAIPAPGPTPAARPQLAGGKTLPSLLFVTNRGRLAANIGTTEAEEAIRTITTAGQQVLDLADFAAPYEAIQRAGSKGGVKGVVILGGYDVVPAERYDTLPPSLRAQMGSSVHNDPDGFIVWSDQIYGDIDGDRLADIPVSRIPDGRSARLVQTALAVSEATGNTKRFGLRNVARPFADAVYNTRVAGAETILISQETRSQTVPRASVDAKLVYLMLHGSDTDSSRFWGEAQGEMLEAMHVGNVPNPCHAVVFSGCCWGALTVRVRALLQRDGDPVQPVTPEQSIALSFLAAGARAFVGCTGAHYSPLGGDDLNYFGSPMHQHFWTHLVNGKEPAEALFRSKIDYIAGMPHGRSKIEETAIENKILREFTCLGLGW